MLTLPNVTALPGMMTEAEARIVGASANRIVNLRGLQGSNSGTGTMTVNTASGTVALTLTHQDITAALALFVEREAALLTGFNIVLETPPA